MNLYFCGMIGSGKTALGTRLADLLGLEFRDLDRVMDDRLGYSFHELVREQGWLAFRELEYDICKGFSRLDHTVVCLGGGTVRYQWNLDALHGTGPIVLLEVSRDELVRRVRAADRPRVNPGTDLEQDIDMMLENSWQKYLAAADMVFKAEGKGGPENEAREMADLVRTDPLFAGVLP